MLRLEVVVAERKAAGDRIVAAHAVAAVAGRIGWIACFLGGQGRVQSETGEGARGRGCGVLREDGRAPEQEGQYEGDPCDVMIRRSCFLPDIVRLRAADCARTRPTRWVSAIPRPRRSTPDLGKT